MATSLFKKTDSASIDARLTDLRAQLTAAQEAATQKRQTLEQVMADGGNSDKALDELTRARTKVETLQGVIVKAEEELAKAKERESLQAQLDEVRNMEKRFTSLCGELERKKNAILQTMAQLEAAEGSFNESANELREIAANVKCSSSARVIPYGKAYREPDAFNNPDSNLRSALTVVSGTIRSMRENFEQLLAQASAESEE